jgi:hypothetical protein
MSDEHEAPRWALEEYPGAEKDFTTWLYGIIYANIVDGIPDKEAAVFLMAKVRARTLERTGELTDLMARSSAYQMWKASEEGWYHFLPGEYDSLREFMHSMSDEESVGGSTKSDLIFLADTLLPALQGAGIEPEMIMSIPEHFSKARAAVPYLREVLDNKEGDELVEAVKKILEGIADDSMGTHAYRDKLAKEAGKIQNIWGDVYIFPGYNMIVIRATDDRFTKYIERRTRGAIEFRGPKDPIELLKEITDQLTGEEDDDE